MLGTHTNTLRHTHTALSGISSSEENKTEGKTSYLGPTWSLSSTASTNPQLSVSQKCLGLVLFEKLRTQMFPTWGCRAVATDPNLFQQAYTQSKAGWSFRAKSNQFVQCTVSYCGVSKWLPESKCKATSQFFLYLTKYLPGYDSPVTWLQIIWGWFSNFVALWISETLLQFYRAGRMLGGRSFKNSLFFREHVSYVTQAVSKCKKM